MQDFFPLNPNLGNTLQTRGREQFKVNFCRTKRYQDSAIPFCQRLLNEHWHEEEEGRRPGGQSREQECREQKGRRAGQEAGGQGREQEGREGEGREEEGRVVFVELTDIYMNYDRHLQCIVDHILIKHHIIKISKTSSR